MEYVDLHFPPILLLMNINGLLVHRTQERINFHRSEGIDGVKGSDEPGKGFMRQKIDFFTMKRNHHYFREGQLPFLRALMSHPRVKFAFYSSIMRKNIMPIITKMFERDMLLFSNHMMALFDQDYNKSAPELTGDKWGMIRDLQKVWDSPACKKLDCNFGPSNTIMLETDEINVHDCIENSLIVDRFEREDVWPTNIEHMRNQVEILTSIKDNIFALLDTCQGDV